MPTALSPSVHPEPSSGSAQAQPIQQHLQPVESPGLAVRSVPTLAATNIRQAARLEQVAIDPKEEFELSNRPGVQVGQSNVFELRRPKRTAPPAPQEAQLVSDIKAMTQCIGAAFIEAELGIRPFAQLSSWLELELFHKLKTRVHHLANERHLAARSGEEASRKIPSILPIGVRAAMRPSGEWESSLTIRVGKRARAIAMRLQLHRKRWRVIALEVG